MNKAQKGKPFDELPPLPPDIDYTRLIPFIAEAHASLARLDETLTHHLRNPKIIEQALLTREAVLSSQIEGTQATLEEVYKEEANDDKKLVDDTSKKTQDIREIINYRMAMHEGIKLVKDEMPLSENIVKKLHNILLQSVRGKTKAPGDFRKCPVHIAPYGTPVEEANFVPPSPQNIPHLYSNFDKYFNNPDVEKDPLVQIAVSHYQFEAIHPFQDGNGRIGRLLIPLFLCKRKIISHPYMYVSKYFEQHRRDYYDLLAAVSYEEKWIEWIRFFLTGISEQAKEASALAREIGKTQQKFHTELSRFKSPYALNLLDALFERPICTTSQMKVQAKIKNTQTLINLIKKFVKAGILFDLTKERQRNKMYAFLPLLDILEKEEK